MQYEIHFGVRITAHIDAQDAAEKFGDKYFHYIDEASGEDKLVDIHVFRGSAELCPKQNLDFALESGDIVELGPLLC
ncbi:hypothetical protein [Burkholderia sp. BE17]|uniref:hypothetical protein n=1 Tax=Burkholderia sp. BE17 TaxID=2656644 RepID=UPI00128B2CDA|nr:hypothetical protein [Burkholderia sp. BE17]MPV64337.1 hypothetical protein [Burkholderia sp. BE17]